MFIISAVLGQKYYPIPYRWGRLAMIFAAMLGIYGLSAGIDSLLFENVSIGASSAESVIARLAVHTALIAVYLVLAYLIVRQKPDKERF